MIIRETINNRFVTATVRKVRYIDLYFAKISIWPSKEHYIKGDCTKTITINNLRLGNTDLKYQVLDAARIIIEKECDLASIFNTLSKKRSKK